MPFRITTVTIYVCILILRCASLDLFFFFQAEDGIRDLTVTGVQTCALPILVGTPARADEDAEHHWYLAAKDQVVQNILRLHIARFGFHRRSIVEDHQRRRNRRSEERRVGKECRSRWSPYH